MLSINQIKNVQISFSYLFNKRILKEIGSFIRKIDLDHYVEERRAELNKARADNQLGKKGEYVACYYFMKYHGFPFIKPDLEIRHGPAKGWYIDIDYQQPIHVKTCSQFTVSYAHDYSWVFQYLNRNGRGGRDPIFDLKPDSQDLVILVFMEEWHSAQAVVKVVARAYPLLKYMEELENPKYHGEKKCLNYKTLLKHQKEIENG